MNIVRELANTNLKAKIVSNANFPVASGLASSAAGFAALSAAVNEALNLGLNKRKLRFAEYGIVFTLFCGVNVTKINH